MKYGPLAQSIAEKLPVTIVPLPIWILTNPLPFVAAVCVSIYTRGPVADPCRMVTRIPIILFTIRLLLELRITAW